MKKLWEIIKNRKHFLLSSSSGWKLSITLEGKRFSLMAFVYGRTAVFWVWPFLIRIDNPRSTGLFVKASEAYRVVDVKNGWIHMRFRGDAFGFGLHTKDPLWGNWTLRFGPLTFNRVHIGIHSGPEIMDMMNVRPLLFIPPWRRRS